MPELHRLTPVLGVLQDQGFHVALVTDGRMSGASGKVPAVIHLSPEALLNGPIGKVQTGDMLIIDAEAGVLDIELDEQTWQSRPVAQPEHQAKTKLVLAVNYLVCSWQQRLLNMVHLCFVHLLAKSHKGRFKTKELQSNEQD